MVSTKQVCEMARSLGGVTEKDHFGSDAFVANKRIFATVWHDRNEVNLMLSREQQHRYLSIDGEGFAEIDNAWGRAGATKVQLAYVNREDFAQALRSAWQHSTRKTARSASTKAKRSVSKENPQMRMIALLRGINVGGNRKVPM